MLRELFDYFLNGRYVAKLKTIETGPEAYSKLSRRQALAWEAGARAGIYHATHRDDDQECLSQPYLGYRFLNPSERLQQGDEWRNGSEWSLVRHTIGARLRASDAGQFRRPLVKGAGE